MADLGAIGDTFQIAKNTNMVAYANPRSGRGGTPPYQRSKYTLSGNVKDDANANTSRRVVAYLRSNGEFVGHATSDPTTGNWSIGTPYNEEHDVLCLDDAAGATYNDLIHRATPV